MLLILTFFLCNVSYAQHKSDTTIDDSLIFVIPETPAQFPGGYKALYEYLEKENQWVQKQTIIKGSVYVRFTVKKDGSLTDIEVVRGMENLCPDCNEEALRLIKNMPKWKPGYFYDKPVDSKYILPIKFGKN